MSTSGASRTAALKLYRSILRAHNHLPPNMRGIGDAYVKNEFRLHKAATDADQLAQFYTVAEVSRSFAIYRQGEGDGEEWVDR